MANVFVIEGCDELHQKLKELPAKVAKKVCSRAMRAGAKVVLGEVRRRSPRQSGALRKSFKVRAGKRKKDRISFTVSTASKEFVGKTFYGSFLTFGWQPGSRYYAGHYFVKTKRGKLVKRRYRNKDRRRVAPNPFIAEAFEAKKGEAERVIVHETREGLRDLVRVDFNRVIKPKAK